MEVVGRSWSFIHADKRLYFRNWNYSVVWMCVTRSLRLLLQFICLIMWVFEISRWPHHSLTTFSSTGEMLIGVGSHPDRRMLIRAVTWLFSSWGHFHCILLHTLSLHIQFVVAFANWRLHICLRGMDEFCARVVVGVMGFISVGQVQLYFGTSEFSLVDSEVSHGDSTCSWIPSYSASSYRSLISCFLPLLD